MSARDRAERVLTEVDLDALEAVGLRVIDEPEAPYLVGPMGPSWRGDGWAVTDYGDGRIAASWWVPTGASAPVEVLLPAEVVAAISAAHIRGSEYR